jgi:transposase InsO family protein
MSAQPRTRGGGRPWKEIDEVAIAIRCVALRRHREAKGSYGTFAVAQAAREAGVSATTVRRRLVRPKVRRHGPYVPDATMMGLIRLHDGNLAEAVRHGREKGTVRVSEKTVRRGMALLPKSVRVGLKKGAHAMGAHEVYGVVPTGRRNDRWQVDHSQLQALVLLDPEGPLVQPWLTIIIDEATRFCVGWCITAAVKGNADTDSIMAVLAEAIATYGKPKALRYDQGGDYIGPSLTLALTRLGIAPDPCAAGKAHKKGKIERWIGTIKGSIMPSMPGYFARSRRAA